MSSSQSVTRVCLLLPTEGSKDTVEYVRKKLLASATDVHLLSVVHCGRARRKLSSPKKAPVKKTEGTTIEVTEDEAQGAAVQVKVEVKGKGKEDEGNVPEAVSKRVEEATEMHNKALADIKTSTTTEGVKLQGTVLTADKPNTVDVITEFIRKNGVTHLVVPGKEQDSGIVSRMGRLFSPLGLRASLAEKCVESRDSWAVIVVTSSEDAEEHSPKLQPDKAVDAAKEATDKTTSSVETGAKETREGISEASAGVASAAETGDKKATS